MFSKSRVESMLNGQSSLARKVYEHVPVEAPWHWHETGAEANV